MASAGRAGAGPEINGVFIMDFLKTQAILDMNVAFKDDLKRRLELAINTPFELPALLSGESAKNRRRSAAAAVSPIPE